MREKRERKLKELWSKRKEGKSKVPPRKKRRRINPQKKSSRKKRKKSPK